MGNVQTCVPIDDDVVVVNKQLPSFRLSHKAGISRKSHAIRLAAVLGGIAYEDEFLTYEENKKRILSPHLIVFDENGKELYTLNEVQSQLRYVGRMAGFYNGSALHRAMIDQIVDHCSDLTEEVAMSLRTESKKDDKVVTERRVPFWLDLLSNKLQENEDRGFTNGYFVGNEMTIADLLAYQIYCFLNKERVKGGSKLFKEREKLVQHQKVMNANEKLRAFNEQHTEEKRAFKQNIANNKIVRKGKFIPGRL